MPADILLELEQLVATIDSDEACFQHRCIAVRDWGKLFETAIRHGVAALLLRRLSGTGLEIPRRVLEGVQQRLALDRLRYHRISSMLHQALNTLERAGLRTVALKGVLLAERLYPEAYLRPTTDLDLLVTPQDAARARRTLEGIGYHSGSGDNESTDRHHIELDHASGVRIELHHQASSGIAMGIPAKELVARAVPYRTARGGASWTLTPEDELLYLAVHAARHRFERLCWLYDLKRFIECHPALDWAAIGNRARSFKVLHAFAIACETLERRLGMELSGPARCVGLPRDLRLRVATRLLSPTAHHSRIFRVVFRFGGVRQAYRALLDDQISSGTQYWVSFMIRRVTRRIYRKAVSWRT